MHSVTATDVLCSITSVRCPLLELHHPGYSHTVSNNPSRDRPCRDLTVTLTLSFSTTGHTDDFHAMLVDILAKHPNTKITAIGFSLGGNLVLKYLGEDRVRPSRLIAGISVCQGYSAVE
jgi:predicted alpha/beta-fold hydrolase